MKEIVRAGFLCCFVIALASNAFADTLTIRPDGQGNYAGWANTGCSAGSSEWQCVDEVANNTSDYLSTTGTAKETFSFGNTGLNNTTIASVNSVTVYYYAEWQTNSKNSCFAATTRAGSTDYDSGVQICTTATYALYSHTYSTNPATGSAWTVSAVDALEAGMYGLNPNGGGRVAQVYAVVDYTPSVCGNNVTETGETCDGTDLSGATCTSLGHSGGTLSCNPSCTGYVETGCYDNSCSDSDGGFVTSVQGTVSGILGGSAYNYTDFCLDTSLVFEYICSGTNPLGFNSSCNGTLSCVNGACV